MLCTLCLDLTTYYVFYVHSYYIDFWILNPFTTWRISRYFWKLKKLKDCVYFMLIFKIDMSRVGMYLHITRCYFAVSKLWYLWYGVQHDISGGDNVDFHLILFTYSGNIQKGLLLFFRFSLFAISLTTCKLVMFLLNLASSMPSYLLSSLFYMPFCNMHYM